MTLNKQEYKEFYNKVGSQIGWDFSSLKCNSEGETWDFYTEVVKKSKPSDLLLDIGTGGGEKVLDISESFNLVVGVDISEGMINTANQNKLNSSIQNARFYVMDAAKVDFPDSFFNIISARQSDFDAEEVFRVLAKEGLFMTQQVGEDDKLNIKTHFGRGQCYNIRTGTAMSEYVFDLKKAGFTKVETFEYNAKEFYERPEDLIFLLKHTPIIPDFGENHQDFTKIESFINKFNSEKGIQTNSKRYMILAYK